MDGQEFAAMFVVDARDPAPARKIEYHKEAAEYRMGRELLTYLRANPHSHVEVKNWDETRHDFMGLPQRQFRLRVKVFPERDW